MHNLCTLHNWHYACALYAHCTTDIMHTLSKLHNWHYYELSPWGIKIRNRVLAKVYTYQLSSWALGKKAIKATDKGSNILVLKLVLHLVLDSNSCIWNSAMAQQTASDHPGDDCHFKQYPMADSSAPTISPMKSSKWSRDLDSPETVILGSKGSSLH